MPQQLPLLAAAAARPPAVASQREKYAALKDRPPPSRPTSPAPTQGSLFAFQAAQQEILRPQPSATSEEPPPPSSAPPVASPAHGEKAKARDILAAVRTLKALEAAQRPVTQEERAILARFPGFGVVALGIFPDPVRSTYKDAGWRQLGTELQALLTPEEYASARRTTFTAFYTSPLVIRAIYGALRHFGVPEDAMVLEPGCGAGNFMGLAPEGMRFLGVELDSLSGRIAWALYPDHDIRIENFRDTRLPEDRIDAVIGNVPFADLRLDYQGARLSLHDFFLATSLEALNPGGVLAVVTSHDTLDQQQAGLRAHMAQRADFLGAIRLPSEAFKQEGTRVVTDILCLRKRVPGEPERHADPAWLETEPSSLRACPFPSTAILSGIPPWCLAPGHARAGSMAAHPAIVCAPRAIWPPGCKKPRGDCLRGCLQPSDCHAPPCRSLPLPCRRLRPFSPKAVALLHRITQSSGCRTAPMTALQQPTARSTRPASPRRKTVPSPAACPIWRSSAPIPPPCWSWPWSIMTRSLARPIQPPSCTRMSSAAVHCLPQSLVPRKGCGSLSITRAPFKGMQQILVWAISVE